MRVSFLLSVVIIVVCCLSSLALGQEDSTEPTPGVGSLTEADEFESALDLGLGFSSIAEDYFIDFNLGFSFGVSKFEVGLLLPLRFRIIDEDPEDESLVRGEDWDEVSDWLRIIHYVQYGQRNETYYARAGELAGVVLGHGTIVDNYNNVVDINHFQWGINGAVNLLYGGVEVLLDNIVSAEVMGMRTYVRPYSFVDPESFWTRFAIGVSFVGDRDAPDRLLLADSGVYIFDSEENLVVDERGKVGVLGVDVEMQVFTNELVSITPYTDVNFLLGHGNGVHIGTLTNFSFSDALALNTRFEFRVLGEGYYPSYFDALYEVERYLFMPLDPTGQRRPKLQVLASAPPEGAIGWLGEGTFGIMDMIYLSLGYENYKGPDNSSFYTRLSLRDVGPVTLGAYYVNQNFDGIEELFDLDDALLVAEARASIAGPFYGILQFSRRFAAQTDGTYEPVDDWGVGFGVSFGF